ncbi:MAG TPA: hypothetical protein VM142_03200 [Acidimicrobiales bacterium]|nr:hypothetical protein [Acidimicrobiales bacterium]
MSNAYRIAADERDRFQIMRLIPPGLGGTNAASNLFPVSTQAHPGAADKTEIDEKRRDHGKLGLCAHSAFAPAFLEDRSHALAASCSASASALLRSL